MTEKIVKRFIAGAVCPRCSELDRLVMYKENEIEFRECVSCDYKDEMRFKPLARELETRVNLPKDVKKAETQVLSLDPNSKKTKQ